MARVRKLVESFPVFSPPNITWKPKWCLEATDNDLVMSDCIVLDRVVDPTSLLKRKGILAEIPAIVIGRENLGAKYRNGGQPMLDVLAQEELSAAGLESLLRSRISEARLRQKVDYLATRNAQMRLVGKTIFMHNLQELAQKGGEGGAVFCLMFVQIDTRDEYHDGLASGMAVRSSLSRAVSDRLTKSLGDKDLITHFDDDSFLILCGDILDTTGAGAIAQELIDAVRRPFFLAKKRFSMACRTGISVCSTGACNPHKMIAEARNALKLAGENDYCMVDAEEVREVKRRLSVKRNLPLAAERGEFQVQYQPQINLDNGRVAGAEALLRWQHKDYGMIEPGYFIPIAEESNTILEISRWVLNDVSRWAAAWIARGIELPRLSVNISGRHLREGRILRDFETLLEQVDISPGLLEFEMTEQILYRDAYLHRSILARLRAMGAHIALDDFGTGSSSLAHLRELPVDTLKIDRSFVTNLPDNDLSAAIVVGIISIAKRMGLRVVAEGIETESQHSFLHENGCEFGQGFLFSPPLSADRFMEKCTG